MYNSCLDFMLPIFCVYQPTFYNQLFLPVDTNKFI